MEPIKKLIIKSTSIVEGITNATIKPFLSSTIQSVIDNRRSICKQCPHLTKRLNLDTCGKCGCFIEAKTASMRESCPIGQWSSHTTK